MSRSSITDELFNATADMPPSSRINLQQVHADGQRIRRRRRIVRSTVACAIVAGLVAGGVAVSGAVGNPFGEKSNRHSPATKDSTPPAPPKPTPPADATAPGKLDPSWPRIKTGWLPDALKQPHASREVDTADYEQDVRLRAGSTSSGGVAVPATLDSLEVHLYAAGGTSPRTGADIAAEEERLGFPSRRSTVTPGPDINGQASQWIVPPAGSGRASGTADENIGGLWWQWAPEAWAEVSIHGAFGGPAKDTAVNVARGLAFDQPEPIKLPFAMPKLPAGMKVVRTEITVSENGAGALVRISDRPLGGRPGPDGTIPPFKAISINVGGSVAEPSADPTKPCHSLESVVYETNGKWDDTDIGAGTECQLGNAWISVRVTKDLVPTFPKADHLAMFTAIAKGMSRKPADSSTWTAVQG